MKHLWQIFEKNVLLLFLLFWFCSALLLFVASPCTSPASPYYAADSSVFYLMGRGILHGLVPYRDMFDHKGPLLYYIYALGQWLIPGKAGVFLLQTASMGASCTLLWKFFRLYVGALTGLILLGVSLLCIIGCVQDGALTEEWSLPLSLWALYAISRHLSSGGKAETLPGRTWFWLGIVCALHSLLRFNNAAPVYGLVAALSLLLLVKGELTQLLKSVFLLVIGFLIPLALCYAYLSFIGAADDFFRSYIVYNFVYANGGASISAFANHLSLAAKLLSLPLMCLAGIALCRKKILSSDAFICFLIMSILSALSLFPGRRFLHYDMIYIPAVACTLVIFSVACFRCKGTLRWICLSLFLASLGLFLKEGGRAIKRKSSAFLEKHTTEYLSLQTFVDVIPKDERSSFWGYDVWPAVYLHTDIMPCHRYFFCQPWLSEFDPSIEKTLEDYFKSASPPKWVVLPRKGDRIQNGIQALKNPVIRDILLTRYEYVGHACQRPNWEDENFSLFRRNK